MSGVRIQNQALRELGLTLPGFIERGQVIASLPSLGLLTLAGATPPHWELSYHEVDDLGDWAAEITALQPDVVAISSLSARVNDAYRLADQLRAAGITVVIGGLHASVRPEEAGMHADTVVVGPGERVWPKLLAEWEEGRLQKCYRHRDYGSDDLSAVPIPRYDLLDCDRYNRITLQTHRGCPHDCTFCGASRLISSYQRKPLCRVEEELDAIQAVWSQPFLELADDNSFVHKPYARDLARTLGRRNIRWFTETDISVADDPDLLELLAESGCAQVLIGLESPVPRDLIGMDRKDWKSRQADRYHDAIGRIQRAGVSVNGCFVLGLDEHDETCFDHVLNFVAGSGLAEVQVTVMTPFPGTELTAQLAAEGRLLKDEWWDECTLFDVVYRPARMSVSDLEDGFRTLVSRIYTEDMVAGRKSAFRSAMREGRRARRGQQIGEDTV